MNENVVLFPGLKRNTPPQTLEEISAKIMENKEVFADEIADELMDFILHGIQQAGYNMDANDTDIVSSVHMIYESIRSVLFQVNGIEHGLQGMAKQLYFDGAEESEENKVVDNEENVD